jgi:hypothetical protein
MERKLEEADVNRKVKTRKEGTRVMRRNSAAK